MKDLAVKSKFKKNFFDKHKDFYDEYITIAKSGMRFSARKTVHDLFGDKGYRNVIVLGCGFSCGDAFSATVTDKNKKVLVYSTITPKLGSGHLSFYLDEALLAHEYGHAYVNPLTAKYQKEIKTLKLSRFYEPQKEVLALQAYVGVESFINESILYGLMAYIKRRDDDDYFYERFVQNKIKSGFTLTPFIVEQFTDYEANRKKYKTFDDFYLVLIRRMAKLQL